MLVKFFHTRDHTTQLKQAFEVLDQHQMKLNLTKCTFGVGSGQILGYLVRGIESNSQQIRALIDMPSPKSIKEVQRLNGRIVALSWFISKSLDHCVSFFKALKGKKNFEWTQECEEAFQRLKAYRGSPPILSKPLAGEPLYLYLFVFDHAVSSVLIWNDSREQWPVYFVSRAMLDAETRYSYIEKLALTLLSAAGSLKRTFNATRS